MRTTLTLEPDVAALVQQEAKRTGASFKGTINDLLRKGLMAPEDKKKEKFVVTPLFMGLRPSMNYDKIEALIEELEGPYHR